LFSAVNARYLRCAALPRGIFTLINAAQRDAAKRADGPSNTDTCPDDKTHSG